VDVVELVDDINIGNFSVGFDEGAIKADTEGDAASAASRARLYFTIVIIL